MLEAARVRVLLVKEIVEGGGKVEILVQLPLEDRSVHKQPPPRSVPAMVLRSPVY